MSELESLTGTYSKRERERTALEIMLNNGRQGVLSTSHDYRSALENIAGTITG